MAAEKTATSKAAADEALATAESAEAAVKAAEAELQAALDEIALLEKTKADKIVKCEVIIAGDGGAVKKGKAVQEKEQLLCEDPLPLRKAKITQGASLKKVTKSRLKAETATSAAAEAERLAAEAKVTADAAEVAAEEAKTLADAAQVAAEVALADAQTSLNNLKAKAGGGAPQGKLWWMERVLAEKRKFTR
jgi:hypothetical protein